jgi:hypothetical protein
MRYESVKSESFSRHHVEESTDAAQENEFGIHELIVADVDLVQAKNILGSKQILCRTRQLSPREVVDKSHDAYRPGEYLIEVVDPERLGEPASAECTNAAFELLRANGVIVRRAKLPG